MADVTRASDLGIFWRRGRKTFVELLKTEVERAGVNPTPLLKEGLIKTTAVLGGSKGATGFIVTEKGKQAFQNEALKTG